LIYNTPQENVKVDVAVKDETIWLTQKAMAALFGVQTPAISKHLKNIFQEGELDEKVVISILEITTQHGAIEGKTQNVETQFYNLDAIIWQLHTSLSTPQRSRPNRRIFVQSD
jgi:hypothetical protein